MYWLHVDYWYYQHSAILLGVLLSIELPCEFIKKWPYIGDVVQCRSIIFQNTLGKIHIHAPNLTKLIR